MILIKSLLLYCWAIGLSFADETVLTQITASLVKTPITQGDFEQKKHLKVLHKPLISTGSFTYDQSKGVIWKTQTPVVSILLVNETRLLTGQGEQAVPGIFGKVFKAMLGGDLTVLAEGFELMGSVQKETWQLTLIPRDALLRKVIGKMILSGDKELRDLEIHEAAGNNTRISFKNITHPQHLTAAQDVDFDRLSP